MKTGLVLKSRNRKRPQWVTDAEKVLKLAVRKAKQAHFKAGYPIHVVRDGKVVRLVA